jgi:hypothetical protein
MDLAAIVKVLRYAYSAGFFIKAEWIGVQLERRGVGRSVRCKKGVVLDVSIVERRAFVLATVGEVRS